MFGADMDVAVLPFNITDDKVLVIPWTTPLVEAREDHEAPWPNLAAGQEVFVVGYPDALTTVGAFTRQRSAVRYRPRPPVLFVFRSTLFARGEADPRCAESEFNGS